MKKRIIIPIIVFIVTLIICLFYFKTAHAADESTYEDINISVSHESTPIPYVDIYMSANRFKSYMSYKAITKKSSPQYALQQLCGTDADGFRKCADRYVIAVGSGVGGRVGDCVDLILANGQVIYCVIGDYKGNQHTDAANLTGKNGCCSEFIVDTALLRPDIKAGGNVGFGYVGWDSPVALIRRYGTNYLNLTIGGN